ncbi:kinesin-like protein KIF15 isoform X2 [Ambystoma mexicanum]|uniref:kinesin-like protein KIF15 isoform X2 n=1 Tax=Ambystoma mexicanum TaxID=8296 RepID=UPI0037E917F3
MAPVNKGESGDAQPFQLTSAEGDAIRVFVRVRPPAEGTLMPAEGDPGMCLSVPSSNTIRLHSKPEHKMFTFDHVANMDSTQESVFSIVAKNIVESCMNGYNGTIFAYGQTGSGKTFTMLGPSDSDNFTHNLRGVIPRSFEYLFFLINREKEKAGDGKSFLCKCSFIEIYNEQIFDLLDSASSGLLLREHIKKGVFVVGAVEQVVTSAVEAYQVLSMGWRNRRVASTSMNRESSRSHAVFTVTVESMETNNGIVNIRSSQLNLVDLAGSERQKDSHAEGVRLKEAGNINRSLSCLGQVITALVDVSNGKQRHICYRDSKLTFLLRDSLGGNAKTYIIANVHPGARCFGETLSTLQFAQRAKLIKNKAVVNEDTHGNVTQLQAEVKKLKEQLSQLLSGQMPEDLSISRVASIEESGGEYLNRFLEAMLLFEKSESEKKALFTKVSQLEDLCIKKERFIQATKMIIKFREHDIARLEKVQREARSSLFSDEQDDFITELKEEVRTLKEQVEQHPRVAKYAMVNHNLREENKRLRGLQSVKRAQEIDQQTIAELEKAFLEASAAESKIGGLPMHSTPIQNEHNSLISIERLKARLLQMQSELATSKQEYEEFKELTKKNHRELESEIQSLLKSNQHLENILEATKAHKRQEVSQLNKMHVETIKNMTTPTKAYDLRSRLVPRISPDLLHNGCLDTPTSGQQMDDIYNEPIPPEMKEQAYEAIAEELRLVQEHVNTLQGKLDEEESKHMKLEQQYNKLEHHSAQMQEHFASERIAWNKEQDAFNEQIKTLEKQRQENESKNDVLMSEVHDLRVVLHSADRELSILKVEHCSFKQKQDKEFSQLSDQHMNIQLQLDHVRLEHEKLLEEKSSLQDAYDNLEEVMKFETDQLKQLLQSSQLEGESVKSELSNLLELLETERELKQKLASQLQEDKENSSKELLKVLEENVKLKKQSSELMMKCDQQFLQMQKLEQDVASTRALIVDLERTNKEDKDVISDLMSQIQELRKLIIQKTESIDLMTRELEDLNCKYSAVVLAKEESKSIVDEQAALIEKLKEDLERKQSADNIEKELLCDDLAHATEQLDILTEASNKLSGVVQIVQEDLKKKEDLIQELQQQLNQKKDEVENLKKDYSELQQAESVADAIGVVVLQSPRTPNAYQSFLQHEREMEDQKATIASLELLARELSEERMAKNEEILRLKGQLCEVENMRLEMQILLEEYHDLKSHQDRSRRGANHSDHDPSDSLEVKKGVQREVAEERLAKNKVTEQMSKVEAELEETRNALKATNNSLIEMKREIDRTRALESKAFIEKEELRSKFEEVNEERDQTQKELILLRKQVQFLAEENGKLVGHQNINQKIQYLVKVKKENVKLTEEVEKLRFENAFLKESRKCENL